MKIRRFILCLTLVSFVIAAAPAGYYDSAAGLTGSSLRQELHNIIDGHTQKSYDYLWTAFATTDIRTTMGADYIWCMYTHIEFHHDEDQQGNLSSDVYTTYNREHSWPKSWANETYPHYTDLFHMYPTQAYSNSHRNNLPYGEVADGAATYTSENGAMKGAARSGLGYTGTVFEPIDDYKGDLARTYFYISTRYLGEDGTWNDVEMANGCELKQWAIDMLLDWHHNDPVSTKETDRNDAVYAIQNNRNPFIDNPAYADSIWTSSGGSIDAPVAQSATTITSSGFTANWNSVTGATGYKLYVSTASDFSSYITNYGPKDVGNTTSEVLTSLSASTDYYYRVRSYDASNESANSNEITLTTSAELGGDVTENFDGWSDGSYGTISTYTDGNGGQWETNNAMSHSDNARTGNAIRFNDDSNENEYLLYKGLDGNGKDGGVGTVSFYYRHWNADGSGCQFQVQYSSNGTDWTNSGSVGSATTTTYEQFSVDVNVSGDNVFVRIISIDDNERLLIDDITISSYLPSITLSLTSLNGFSYQVGNGPSDEQTFTISASDLSADISIDAPTNYEISTGTGESFSASDPLVLTQSGGTVSETSIYVRLKAGLTQGDYNNEMITASSTGLNDETVECDGSVTAASAAPISDLSPGDIAFTGVNMDNPDQISIVFLVAIANGTEIKFSDNGWKADNTWRTGEGIHTWTASREYSAGEEIVIDLVGPSLSASGDQVIAYQNTSDMIAALNSEGDHVWQSEATSSNTSALPQDLSNGTNCVALVETDNIMYDRSVTSGTKEELLAAINDYTNWSGSDSSPQTLSTAGYTISGGASPICLSSFTAKANKGVVELSWETASETNNAQFVLYRNDEVIATLAGAGTTTETNYYSYTDATVVPGVTYTYVLADVDYANTLTRYDNKAVTVALGNDIAVVDFEVGAAYPNPFNPRVALNLEYKVKSHTVVNIYNAQGKLVDQLYHGMMEAGKHELSWDASNMSTGIYLIFVQSGNMIDVQKVAFVK